MAPTEILARQHLVCFQKWLQSTSIQCSWLDTSAEIVVGTHALLNLNIRFKNLKLVLFDEQQRFGVRQKKDLIENDGFAYLENYQDTNFNQIDIFSPCATGGDLNQEFLDFSKIKKVNCVLGAANNQLADDDIEQKLFNEGIIYCPDYCVNAGGVIILALRSSIKEDMEYDEPEAKKKLTGIKDQLKNILLLSKNKNQLSTVSSNELAEQGFQ